MTNKQFFEAVITANMSEELTAHAQKMLDQLTKERESAKSRTNSARAEANRPVVEAIKAFLADGLPHLTSEVATGCGISTSKASSLLVRMEVAKEVTQADVKIKGVGTRKAWTIVSTNEAPVECAE